MEEKKTKNFSKYPTLNREYKDSLFRLIFSEKKDLLDLYNALNGTSYSDPKNWKSIHWRMQFIFP